MIGCLRDQLTETVVQYRPTCVCVCVFFKFQTEIHNSAFDSTTPVVILPPYCSPTATTLRTGVSSNMAALTLLPNITTHTHTSVVELSLVGSPALKYTE